jgi:leucine dehydrogenase
MRAMGIFDSREFDSHEELTFVTDTDAGLHGIIAIHNTHRGPALGGCRMMNYPTEADGVRDALRLSRAMTYKAAAANVPFGGGKCVVFGDPAVHKTPAMMRAVGRAVGNLGGRFFIGEDVGTTVQDMAELRRETSTVLGMPPEMGGSGDPSVWTARGCVAGIRAAVAHRGGDVSLEGLSVAVQGLGHVGWELCRALAPIGVALVVTDLRSDAVARAADMFGADVVDPGDIYDAEADVFAPCALGGAINDETLRRLRTRIVAGSANNQLEEERHDAALRDHGILYAPDYVINAGGMIRFAGEILGWSLDRVRNEIDGIHETLLQVFHRSDAEGIPTGLAANQIAEARFR